MDVVRRFALFALLCCGLFTVTVPTMRVHGGGVNLAAHLSRHYVLLVLASNAADADYVRQVALLAGREGEIAAHKVVVGITTDDADGTFAGAALSAEQAIGLRNYLLVARGQFVVVLLGKDGSIELLRVEPVSTDAIFACIDGMPMRQAEMHGTR